MIRDTLKAKRRFLAFAIATLLSGCAVGPDFIQPQRPAVDGYTFEALPTQTASVDTIAGASQRFVPAADIPAQWWTVFQSERMNALIGQAIRANPSIPAAEAALRAAQETVRAQRGAYLPQVGANLASTRQSTAELISPALASGDNLYNLHTAQLNISYTPDVFGANRRQVEALQAQADYQRFQLEAAHLSLSANVVATVVQIASLRGQIGATQSTIQILLDQLGILHRQLELGAIAEANVIAQEGTLAQTRATLPNLMKQLAQQQDLLAVLTGAYPGEVQAMELDLGDLHLPQALPISLPSSLAEHRPDIRSAEQQLRAASAQVGVATANMYPQITITGGLGSSATRVADLFAGGTGFWSLAGSLAQPIFQGGSLLHRKRAAESTYEQALYQYRGTVLSAFQNVADALHALRFDADTLAAAATVERTALQSLNIARRQVELGDTSYLALLTFEQAYQQARLSTVQAQAARFADTAALFQALGGGWWNRDQAAALTEAQP
jgi:NodT family efflux transporter outer membrane factor (OMF) lipoprotein